MERGTPSRYLLTPRPALPCANSCASSLWEHGNLGRLETRRNMPWEKPEPVELPAFRTDGSKEGCQPDVQCKSRDTAQIGAAGDNHKSSLLIATISLAYRIGKTQRRDVRSAQPTAWAALHARAQNSTWDGSDERPIPLKSARDGSYR